MTGSYGGRQPITVTGQGFSANTIVEICENVCAVLNWTNTEIDCMTPSNDDYSSEGLKEIIKLDFYNASFFLFEQNISIV